MGTSLTVRSAFALLIFATAIARAQPAVPPSLPTARDLYIGCSLVLRKNDVPQAGKVPYSAATCAVVSLEVMILHDGRDLSGGKRRFCLPLPKDEASHATEMPRAYVEYYEAAGGRFAARDGKTVFIAAMLEKFPCKPGTR
jgi:hypothetical protein